MKIVQRIVLPVFIVGFGLLCAGVLIFGAPKAEKEAPPPRVVSVEVDKLQPMTELARVQASGEVTADQQVVLSPEVSGRIVRVSDALVPGSRLSAGAPLAWIDARDYQAALVAEQTRLQQARLELEVERGRQSTARKEWSLLGDDRPDDQADLQLRKPHLALAEANVAAAEAAVERAERNVARTVLRSPFNAMVVAESIDKGQLVQPGAQAVTLIGTDRVRIEVSVPVDRLEAIQVPGWNGDTGSMVSVTQAVGGRGVSRNGQVMGLVGQLDPSTRTARVIIGVDDPLSTSEAALPLLPGAFVDVEIVGRPFEDVYRLPRVALVDGDAVWTVEKGALARRSVDIVWRGRDVVFVRDGLEPGAEVVTSPLALPVEGMAVQVEDGTTDQAAAADGEG